MKNQIVENNRMIAEFMGAKIEFFKLDLPFLQNTDFRNVKNLDNSFDILTQNYLILKFRQL